MIVAIESDRRIRELKGPGRPIHTEEQRKEILESLNFIDKVIVLKDKMTDKDYLDFVVKIRPSVIAVTEGDVILKKKERQAKIVGASIVKIPKMKALSTSQISKLLQLD